LINGINPREARWFTLRKIDGKSAPDVKNILTGVQVGPVQIELVRPLSEDSIHQRFLGERGEGISHITFTVRDFEHEISEMISKGFKVILSGQSAEGAKYAYFDTERIGGFTIVLIEWPPGR